MWPTDELFNINSNINIIKEGQWTESGLSQKHTYLDMRGLDAKRVISQKVKIEFLPVLCCHVVDSSTLKVL